MKKSELFDGILAKVCEVCEVDYDAVIGGSKAQYIVDARCLAIQYLRRAGLSSDEIALIILRKTSGVEPDATAIKKKAKAMDNLFKSYTERCLQSKVFCLLSKHINEWCVETYKELIAKV